jgi:glycosyltransferase involved in cell wall biosynthesis
MTPTVTWLMPVRNGMPFLRETLAAVEAQRFPHAHALFAWDNGSTDGTVEELNRWIPGRIPGRVFAGQARSVGGSLAALVEAAASEWCARIDADDVPEPDRLACQVAFLERNPDVAAVGSQVTPIDRDGAVAPGRREPYYVGHDDIVHQLLYRVPLRHPAVMFRRSAVLAVGNYADIQPSEDFDLLLRLAARYRLANLPQPLLRYRYHDASVSQNMPNFAVYHREVRSHIFARHAAAAYGLDESVAGRLSRGELRCAIPALVRIARHLERRGRYGLWARLGSESFQASALKLVSPRDRLTRAFLAVCRRRRAAATADARPAAAAAAAAVEPSLS